MTIQYRVNSNLFDSSAQTLVNTVNTVGVMGKGLAWQFKNRYPSEYFEAYRRDCKLGKLSTDHPTLYRVNDEQWVLNFATKEDWRNPSGLHWVKYGLSYFVANYRRAGIRSIAFPKLGCGNGGLTWDTSGVGETMAYYLDDLPIPVEIYINEGDTQYHYHPL